MRWNGKCARAPGKAEKEQRRTDSASETQGVTVMANEGKETRSAARYAQLVSRLEPKSPFGNGLFRAFWVGGVICMIGQGIADLYAYVFLLGAQAVATATSITLIFLSALLTGIGVYDRIGKYAGAGSIVPITGFANSVVAPAMEFRREGLVMGVGAKLFTLAGPVLVYGIGSSILVGLLTLLLK